MSTADRYGSAPGPRFMGRTMVVDSQTRYVNVQHGETVTIRTADAAVNWTFDGIGST